MPCLPAASEPELKCQVWAAEQQICLGVAVFEIVVEPAIAHAVRFLHQTSKCTTPSVRHADATMDQMMVTQLMRLFPC